MEVWKCQIGFVLDERAVLEFLDEFGGFGLQGIDKPSRIVYDR